MRRAQQNDSLADVGAGGARSGGVRLGAGCHAADAHQQQEDGKPGHGNEQDEHLRGPVAP